MSIKNLYCVELCRQVRRLGSLLRRDAHTVKSLMSIAVVQVAVYVLPLVTLPYLARVVGVDGFAVIGLAAAIGSVVGLVIDWGFGFTAVQAVAAARDVPGEVNRIIWNTIAAKALLAIPVLFALVASVELLVADQLTRVAIIVCGLGLVAGSFGVDWALRGLERFDKSASASIAGRVVVLPCYFLLVQSEQDIVWAVAIQTGAGVVSAAISWSMVWNAGHLSWPTWSISGAARQIRGGSAVFMSQLVAPLGTGSGVVMLTLLSTTNQLGLFAGSDKIRVALQRPLAPMFAVFFSRISFMVEHDSARVPTTVGRVIAVQFSIAVVVAIGMVVLSEPLVRILLGSQFSDAIPVVQVFAISIVSTAMNGCLNQMIMLPMNMRRAHGLTMTSGALMAVLLMAPCTFMWGAIGSAIALVCSEIFALVVGYTLIARSVSWFGPQLRLCVPRRSGWRCVRLRAAEQVTNGKVVECPSSPAR